MNKKHIRDGLKTVTPYLTVEGAEKLIDFVVKVFAAQVISKSRRPDGRIANAEIKIDDSVIEVSDATPKWGTMTAGLHLYVKDTDAVYKKAMESGAESLYEPADMPYGERSAGVRDETGNNWYIATFMT